MTVAPSLDWKGSSGVLTPWYPCPAQSAFPVWATESKRPQKLRLPSPSQRPIEEEALSYNPVTCQDPQGLGQEEGRGAHNPRSQPRRGLLVNQPQPAVGTDEKMEAQSRGAPGKGLQSRSEVELSLGSWPLPPPLPRDPCPGQPLTLARKNMDGPEGRAEDQHQGCLRTRSCHFIRGAHLEG